jgi:hypothetical protein
MRHIHVLLSLGFAESTGHLRLYTVELPCPSGSLRSCIWAWGQKSRDGRARPF